MTSECFWRASSKIQLSMEDKKRRRATTWAKDHVRKEIVEREGLGSCEQLAEYD